MISTSALILAVPLLAAPVLAQDRPAMGLDSMMARGGHVQLAQKPPVDPENPGGAQNKPSAPATTRAGASYPGAAKDDDKYMRQGVYDAPVQTRGLHPKAKKQKNIESVK